MDYEQIKNTVLAVVSEIQANSGRSTAGLNESTCPLTGMPGFDSINAVESSMLLSERLGCEVKPDIALFAQGGRPRSIAQITKELVKIIPVETK